MADAISASSPSIGSRGGGASGFSSGSIGASSPVRSSGSSAPAASPAPVASPPVRDSYKPSAETSDTKSGPTNPETRSDAKETKAEAKSDKELTPAERAKKAEDEAKKVKEECEKLKKELDELKAKFNPAAKQGCQGGGCGGQKGGGCGGAGGPQAAGGAGDSQGPVNDSCLQEQARAVINAMRQGQQAGQNGQAGGQVDELKGKLHSTVQRALQSQFKPQPETRALVKQACGNDPFPPAERQAPQAQPPEQLAKAA